MTRRVASSTITVMITPMIMSVVVRFVDIEDAIDDVVVVDEQIEDRRRRQHQQREIERARQAFRRAAAAVDDEHQHHREQQMRAAEPHRLRRAERDRPHVIDHHQRRR